MFKATTLMQYVAVGLIAGGLSTLLAGHPPRYSKLAERDLDIIRGASKFIYILATYSCNTLNAQKANGGVAPPAPPKNYLGSDTCSQANQGKNCVYCGDPAADPQPKGPDHQDTSAQQGGGGGTDQGGWRDINQATCGSLSTGTCAQNGMTNAWECSLSQLNAGVCTDANQTKQQVDQPGLDPTMPAG